MLAYWQWQVVPMIITARYTSFGMFVICNYGHIAYVIPPENMH